jgi:predicted anti-sigma-YlaC factor YlaD
MRSIVCDRIRSYVSLGLDGELSQLEQAMMVAHLQRCADCRAYETDVVVVTGALRAAEAEVPERVVVLPRRHRHAAAFRAVQAASAAAVVLVAAGLGLFGAQRIKEAAPTTLTQRTTATVVDLGFWNLLAEQANRKGRTFAI